MWKKKPINHARELRRNSTDAERLLWKHLRAGAFAGRKFRRQYPIGRYILDFVSIQDRLAIELDGGQHAIRADADAERTAWLQVRGYRALRFWNNDVLGNLDGVLETIALALKSPHPDPLPQERERESDCS